jgi:hypothetical protein
MYLVHRIATDLYLLKEHCVNSPKKLSPYGLHDQISFPVKITVSIIGQPQSPIQRIKNYNFEILAFYILHKILYPSLLIISDIIFMQVENEG